MTEKLCNKCGEIKVVAEFSKRGKGFQSWCKKCSASHNKQWFKDNYKDSLADTRRSRAREYKYGLTQEQFDLLKEEQDFLCALCREAEPTVVDHDHKCCSSTKTCGKCVRGLLCQKCNIFIGHFESNLDLIDKVYEYIA